MKTYKFLVPVGIAATALLGQSANATVTKATDKNVGPEPSSNAETLTSVPNLATTPQTGKYIVNGEEHALTLKSSGQGVLYAQHDSHSSHSSHSSHTSHSSHVSGS